MKTALPTVILSTSLLLLGTGCRQEGSQQSVPAQPEAAPVASEPVEHSPAASDPHEHAPAGVEPGSHEDWCGAHAVPESLCTRCNPALIPAFQATGDWCPEHALPESQCLICNPELEIERPPKGAEG